MSGTTDMRRLAHARRRARRLAMQALYQWQLTGYEPKDILSQFRADPDEMKNADDAYFRDLLLGVTGDAVALDALLEPYLDRRVEMVDPVERAILRLATFELRDRLDVPTKVAINEAVELARKFGAEQGHRFINGVLDHAAKKIRLKDEG